MKKASTHSKSRFLAVGGGLLALTMVGVWFGRPQSDGRPIVRVVKATPKTVASGSGVRVFIDPATGQIREPTAAEAKALQDAAGPSLAATSEPIEITGPGGAIGLKLPEGFDTSAVLNRNSDGTLAYGHVTGNPVGSPVAITPGAAAKKPVSGATLKKEQPNDR